MEYAHRDSCSTEDMDEFLENNYNAAEIQKELNDDNNIFHLILYNGVIAGFSKIILNAAHPNLQQRNVSKLDRIYLLKDFYGLKPGLELLNFNIDLAKSNGQCGMWLFTWVGNQRAVKFYLKAGFHIIGSHKFKVTETHYNKHHQMFLKI